MKTLYILILSTLLGTGSFAQTYYIYTASKSGAWNDGSVWTVAVRTDGISKTKVIIPAAYTITADNAVNSFGLGDVDINIMGAIAMQPSTTISLTSLSTISLVGSGKITGTSNTQKINIGTVTKYNGGIDFTKSGASVASSSTGTSPLGFSSAALLPVVFNRFTASRDGNDILLEWSTASELSSKCFAIERSYNGSTWTTISTVKAAGSSAVNSNYTYRDVAVNGASVYYRLKEIDLDGAFLYSVIKAVHNGNMAAAKIYGSAKTLTIELNTRENKSVTVTVMNSNGQVVQQKQYSSGYKITMNIAQPTGIAIVNVADNAGLNQTVKLVL